MYNFFHDNLKEVKQRNLYEILFNGNERVSHIYLMLRQILNIIAERELHQILLRAKKASKKQQYKLELTAFPDDGYQVKEWKFNGEIVESNKSISFTAIVEKYKQDKNIVTVEFEPIPSEN